MKIETKFNINDLTQRKYDRPDDTVVILEIMEIKPIICIAGAQVFYTARTILMHNKISYKKGAETYKWVIERAIPTGDSYQSFREDELIPCPNEYKKIILGK